MHSYLLIGSGRVATHLRFYFSNLGVALKIWSREEGEDRLKAALAECDVVLLAISDGALNEWVERADLSGKTLVHFAGAKYFEKAWGFHPLMTFSPKLYPPEFYPNIPFVAETGFPADDLFPFLKNPIAFIPPGKKPLYHALCNMAANFPALLWVQVFAKFESELQLPPQLLHPLVQQSLENVFADGTQALTGPLRRGDRKTMTLHESALLEYPTLQSINQSWNEWAGNYPLPEATP